MISKSSACFRTHWDWFNNVLGEEELVLCYTSALECLDLFYGYLGEKEIDAYATRRGKYENINYRILSDFNSIDIVKFDNISCTSVNQTVYDMLNDFNNIDQQSLVEALSNYYFRHDESFKGLIIEPKNVERFNSIKNWAVEYHIVR